MNLDRQKMVGEVARKMNILISEDDPVFSCVLLNQIVLESILEEAVVRIQPVFNQHEKKMHHATIKLNESIQILTWILGVAALTVIILLIIFTSHQKPLTPTEKTQLAAGKAVSAIWKELDATSQQKIRAAINRTKK